MFSSFTKLLKSNKIQQNLGAIMEPDCNHRGNSMDDIHRGLSPWELHHLPPIVNKRDHAVLFQLPIDLNSATPPTPHRSEAKWDSSHVRLPCASQNEYLISDENNPDVPMKEKRWEIIQTALLRPINSSRELEKAILSYNTKYAKHWKFHALHELFDEELEESEAAAFFKDTLPEIIRLALQLPDIIPSSIPLLKHGTSKSISLTQQQVACLLANAFLCTFPRRNEYNRNSEYRNFPSINFNSLYQMRHSGEQVLEKIKCICFYFRTVCKKMPNGVITFARRTISPTNFPDWSKCQSAFNDSSMVHISTDGTIEDDGDGLLQVDFANKFIGGGVLNYGCVQEEIRFVICPELLCSRLFTEQLDLNESLIIMGCERFNSYHGYASSFKWTGGYEDETPTDVFRRKKCAIVAIDAICFREKAQQFQEDMMKRELDKAFVGFYHELNTPAPGVATGNWGCGAFNGDKSLKSLLQLMVCCVTNRPLVYFTFGDDQLRDDFYSMVLFLKSNKVKIAELWTYLNQFRKQKLAAKHLYSFIVQSHMDVNKAKQNSSTKCQTRTSNENIAQKSSDIHSSTEPQLSDPMDSALDVDTDQMEDDEILQQIDEAELGFLLQRKKTTSKSSDTTIEFNEEQKTKAADDEASTSVIIKSSILNETQEKRQRSLLDCLDRSYYSEMPSKIKRESKSPIKTFIRKQENLTDASLSMPELLNISMNEENIECLDSDTINICQSIDNIDGRSGSSKVSIGSEINSNLIKEMDNELESLHVVSESSGTESDVIQATPPSFKTYSGNSKTTEKSPKTILDYFRKS